MTENKEKLLNLFLGLVVHDCLGNIMLKQPKGEVQKDLKELLKQKAHK